MAVPILLVEDNIIAGMGLQVELAHSGYHVDDLAATVAEALEVLARSRPAAAVLDFKLPDGNSIPVARALDSQRIPFCFLTGYTELPEVDREFPSVQRFIKPVALATLVHFLDGVTAA